jgi:uncharacterized membrane protein YbhN (UPF0104 family)
LNCSGEIVVVWVLATAEVPHWALVAFLIAACVGFALFTVAWLGARRHHRGMVLESMGNFRRLLVMARQGLSVLKAPIPLAGAILLQCLGWLLQLLAVWAAMRAFDIGAPLPAAGLVLVLMNIATIVPLWPGNIGLVQAAVALPLRNYGVPYATGFAYGLALQVLEMACGVGLGLIALTREGISLAVLRRMQDDEDSAENVVEGVRDMTREIEHEYGPEPGPEMPPQLATDVRSEPEAAAEGASLTR